MRLQVLGAVYKYHKVPRVNLFGRFMGLYDALDEEDYKFFFHFHNYVTKLVRVHS